MPNVLRRVIDAFTSRRSLDAGSPSRRWPAGSRISSLNNEIQARNAAIRDRAAHFARNNPHIAFGVNALVSNIVGPGITPNSQHPDPEVRKALGEMWLRWTDRCDIEGRGDFYAFQGLAVRQMVETGESFTRMVVDRSEGREIPLKLQMIHPSQVPTDVLTASVKPQMRAGIEYSADGLRRVAYHVLPMRPDDFFQPMGSLWTPIRIPADDVCHLFDRLEPGQVRGLSWLAPVLTIINELDQLQDAALVRAKLGNLICAALIDPEGDGAGLGGVGTQEAGVLDVSLEPGTILPFKGGSSLEFFEPKESANYAAFVKSHMLAVAAGLGIPFELVTPDLSQVNYSSIRAGWIEFWRKVEYWQHNIVVFNLCRPVWDRFIQIGVLSGRIDASAYAKNPGAYHAVEWLPPRKMSVDPEKDLKAEVGAIDAGLMSRTQALAGRGLNIDRVRAEIAAEREADAAAGLNFTEPKPGQAPQEPKETENAA